MGIFMMPGLLSGGLDPKQEGPQDCMNILNYRTIPPTLKFIFYQLRPPENQAALDSFKWPHQINSTYQNKKEQEPSSKQWQLLTLPLPWLLFSLPAVQSDCLLFFSNCSKAVIQLQRNKNKIHYCANFNELSTCVSKLLVFYIIKILSWAREMAQYVKALADKSENLSLTLGTIQWKERTNSCKVYSDLHICTVAHLGPQSQNNYINVIFLKSTML